MARPKRPPHPMLKIAREHIRRLDATLKDAPIRLHQLDGPPGSPRFAVSVARCFREGDCPHEVISEAACPILECDMRHSLRLLFTREGELVEVIKGDLKWEQ